jgi:hypothetical protein
MAMPWGVGEGQGRGDPGRHDGEALAELNALFDACFRIQREASEAAGRHIPMVVENVRGAQPWVGRAAWNYGSYYLWGDVPALMPPVRTGARCPASASTAPAARSRRLPSTNTLRSQPPLAVGVLTLARELGSRPGLWRRGRRRPQGRGRGRGMVRSEPLPTVQQVQCAESRQRQDRQDPVRAEQPHRPRLSAGGERRGRPVRADGGRDAGAEVRPDLARRLSGGGVGRPASAGADRRRWAAVGGRLGRLHRGPRCARENERGPAGRCLNRTGYNLGGCNAGSRH